MDNITPAMGIPLGDTRIGFAGSPSQAQQQRMGDVEGPSLALPWEAM